MSKEERIGYLANLDRCKAQQTLHNRNFEPTDMPQVYDLYLLATGDEDIARRAQAKSAELLVEQRCAKTR